VHIKGAKNLEKGILQTYLQFTTVRFFGNKNECKEGEAKICKRKESSSGRDRSPLKGRNNSRKHRVSKQEGASWKVS
jgi:hypothetical protein